MANKKLKPIIRPTRQNVEQGDLVVLITSKDRVSLIPIIRTPDMKIVAAERKPYRNAHKICYENALVLKKDGTYLIGESMNCKPYY